ncbi:Uncharacterised protein [Shigella sonnei]|nr:Uncharacterised protein [Shigella sonnei]
MYTQTQARHTVTTTGDISQSADTGKNGVQKFTADLFGHGLFLV